MVELGAEPAVLVCVDDDLVVLTVEGLLQRWGEAGVRWERPTGLLAARTVVCGGGGIAVIGDDGSARRVLVFDGGGERRLRARVPARTAIGVQGGRLVWVRSLPEGLATSAIGEPLAAGGSTNHLLTVTPHATVGVTEAGVAVWSDAGALAVRQGEVGNVALDVSGGLLAFGTKNGAVGLVRLDQPEQRKSPPRIEAHTGPVRGLSFATRGRWLATIGDRCRVWTYATPTLSPQ